MHAGWNALIKVRLDPFLLISLMSIAMAAISLACLALRESSILFALFLSTLMLRERLTPWRITAAILILASVAGLRMA